MGLIKMKAAAHSLIQMEIGKAQCGIQHPGERKIDLNYVLMMNYGGITVNYGDGALNSRWGGCRKPRPRVINS